MQIFENEHKAGIKPKNLDVMIVKKVKKGKIKKNIGRIFRGYNILTYKGPEASLNIDDFYEVYAYACFYKADSPVDNQIKIDDITISFFCHRCTKKLIKHLTKDKGYRITRLEQGIYYIKGDAIPMQLVLIPELTEEKNPGLTALLSGRPRT